MLRAQGIEVIPHALDDHARITGADISFADLKPVLMTEKDAVKCKKLADDRHWYIPVDVVFDEADATKLMEIVTMKINDRKPKADEVEHG
jgi:tetraacyldisaccharide 4'-kinase